MAHEISGQYDRFLILALLLNFKICFTDEMLVFKIANAIMREFAALKELIFLALGPKYPRTLRRRGIIRKAIDYQVYMAIILHE